MRLSEQLKDSTAAFEMRYAQGSAFAFRILVTRLHSSTVMIACPDDPVHVCGVSSLILLYAIRIQRSFRFHVIIVFVLFSSRHL